MSQEKVNPRLIKSNVDLFGKIVKRPAITEKILSRPPFRFLFDLTINIIKTTGYLRGLYSEEEFNFENVNGSKESKMAFLDKLIDVIGLINSKTIDVKSAKIVAGVEVEKTNRFLNEFAKCVIDKKPFLEAVEKVKKGYKPGSSSGSATMPVKNVTGNDKRKTNVKPGNNKTPTGKTKQTTTASGQQQQKQQAGGTKAAVAKPESAMSKNDSVEPPISPGPPKPAEVIDDSFGGLSKESDEKELSYSVEQQPDETIPIDVSRRPSYEISRIIPPGSSNLSNDDDYNSKPTSISPDESNQERRPRSFTMVKSDAEEYVGSPIMNQASSSPSVVNEIQNDVIEDAGKNDRIDHLSDSNIPEPDSDFSGQVKEQNESIVNVIEEDSSQQQQSSSNTAINQTNQKKLSPARAKTKVSSPPPPPNALGGEGNINSVSTSPAVIGTSDVSNRLKSSRAAKASARPKSSRPAPPRVMTASRSRLSQLMENRNTAEQIRENATNAAGNVWIPETVDDESDEYLISSQKLQENFLNEHDRSTIDLAGGGRQPIESENGESKGHLVKQLMETKNELEGQINSNENEARSGDQAGRNDTKHLRNQIQALCQSIGTLSRAMAYLHEDVGPMLDELNKWQEEYESNNKVIGKLHAEMNTQIEPLKRELEQLERQVDDYGEQVRLTKANVFRNERTISKLIGSI